MVRFKRALLAFGILVATMSWAAPPYKGSGAPGDPLVLDPIDLFPGPTPSPGPKKVPNGPDGLPEGKLKGPTPQQIAADQAKQAADGLRKFNDLADYFNVDMLTGELQSGSGLVWLLWEVGKRALQPTEMGPAHPVEDPDTYKFDAYRNERVLRLRQELDIEAKKAREKMEKEGGKIPDAQDPGKRTLTRPELALVAGANVVSGDAAAVVELLLRYDRKDSPIRIPEPSPALAAYQQIRPLPIANACWSNETKLARSIPYTVPGRACAMSYPNGAPARPGVAVTRPYGQSCRVSWGTCPLPWKDVAGAACGCLDPYPPPGLSVPVWPGRVLPAPTQSL
ncbi:hypothetical protein [Ramlibacter sp. AN1133]|uniref:hypothetical protein n=1 Tax=Ramlibacter sp. AN1133 TaxID=3133429 RepID=UPI0030C04061